MEEILTLHELLLAGDVAGALAIVEELEEMGRSAIVDQIYSYAIVLLIHLIKQKAEQRSTRSWEVSIRNAVHQIQRKNKRRKSGGYYLSVDELQEILDEAYASAIDRAALEAFEGRYEAEELAAMVDRAAILKQALTMIDSQAQAGA
ncbi:hypothetical protein AMR42_11980 [Limnothrix sp. PR1529]|uniref:DUF29 family protein n=1 Tax=Limnothrix sp. PR1529 TaxID=1704291 RepID=UPI00081EB0E3|nr:DUF29 family protein [Limnothrix sp. PR1529]OCQ90759.1 hypothetical protein BCR12_03410 [Limnothrix sp. P13C2]PIB09878.1 hypothetical protein AMR42_11980 [Limnothrix sp. PR1529]